jgi:hypothetical protein
MDQGGTVSTRGCVAGGSPRRIKLVRELFTCASASPKNDPATARIKTSFFIKIRGV